MIQRLRRKFIIINMSFVAFILIIVFTAICFSTYQKLQRESIEAMRRMIERTVNDKEPPKFEIGTRNLQKPHPMTPIFCVKLKKADNSIDYIKRENVTVSNETAETAVRYALLYEEKKEGIIPQLDIRFLKQEFPDGIKIAFADLSEERDSMKSLIIMSLFIGFGAMIIFFLINLFLSSWVLRPVEHAWKQQKQFVADASHELKTPLTVILANIGILVSHKNDTINQQIKWVEYIDAEAKRMKGLVDDLLFLAKSDSSNMPLLFNEFNLSDLIWCCILPFESVAFEYGIILNTNIEENIFFKGDEKQIKQLIIILMDNACKYTEKNGYINIDLKCIQEKICISINNSGNLISESDIKHIFERFYRADKSRSREQGGYGLGLSIAKSIVDNHKGKIKAESSENYGTTFLVCLPLYNKLTKN